MLLYIKNQPEVVHVAHLVVEHREEAKKKVKSDDVGQMESNVPAVREQDAEPEFILGINNFLYPIFIFGKCSVIVGGKLSNKL